MVRTVEAMHSHLAGKRDKITRGFNGLVRLDEERDNWKAAHLTSHIETIRALHPDCVACQEFDGTHEPPREESE